MDSLPKPLETMMVHLLETFQLTSWNITGGKYFTQVNVRFGVETMADHTVKQLRYKKVSDSKIKRDADRRRDWNNRFGTASKHPDTMEVPQALDGLQAGAINKDSASANIATHESCTVLDASQNCQQANLMVLDSQQGQSDTAVANIIQSSTEYTDIEIGLVCKQKTVSEANNSELGEVIDQHDDTLNTSEDSSDSLQTVHYSCDICSKVIAVDNKWHRCTECDDYDICNSCYKRGHHAKHRSQIHEFNEPDNLYNGYCDSCGYVFRPQSPSFFVHQCTICEDYALCKKCMHEGMHQKHADKIKRVRAQEYINDIG